MSTLTTQSTATPDGVLRFGELTPDRRSQGSWDGKILPFVPTSPTAPAPGIVYHDDFDEELDPITYQVLRWRLWNINLEHDETIRRVCGTSIVCYTLDYNTSMLTENGDTVIGGPSLQRFVSQGDLSVKYLLENRSVNPGIVDGDVFILNDPYIACSHQLDVNACAPIFWDGRVFGWVFNAAHQLEMGGTQVGSFCYQAKDIFDEPNAWPPVRLVHRGEVQQDILEAFKRQSRIPAAVALNLRSQIAGLEAAERRLKILLDEHGPRVVKGVMRRMIRDTSQAVSERLLQIPDGQWEETFYLGGTPDRAVVPLRTTLQKTGDVLTVGNAGTAPQMRIGNGTYCGFRGAAISCLQTLLAWDQMYCPAGVLNQLRFDPEPGTVTVANFPSAVSVVYGVNLSVGMTGQVVSKMLLCGPDHLRERAIASSGLANAGYCLTWGVDRSGALRFAPTLEAVIGALGASPGLDGVDTGGSWEWPRTESGNVEEAEASAPIFYLYRREQVDSGGPGRWRGGNGVELAYAGHDVRDMFFLALGNDPSVNNALGLSGGLPGHSGNWLGKPNAGIRDVLAGGRLPGTREDLERAVGSFDRLSTCAVDPLILGDDGVAIGEYCAGGGYGDALKRDAESVAADVAAGAVSRTSARLDYGVVLTDAGAVDLVETEALRRHVRDVRLGASTAPTAPPTGHPRLAPDDQRRPVTDGLELASRRGEVVWSCSECGTVLGPADGNFRHGCALRQRQPHEVDAIRYPNPDAFVDVPLVIREWLCPQCAQLLAADFCRADDEPMWDIRLDLSAIRFA